jgi:ribosome maturation factor RimP
MQLVERTVEGLGYELVDVERAGAGLLRVTLDAPQTPGGVGLDDCERVSHQLTHLFAVEGVDYERLEVSSPGLDRRLTKARDFARFVGHRVQVQLFAPVAGRRRLQARLLGLGGEAGGESVRLELVEDDAARRRAPAGRRRSAPVAAAPQVIEVALADIERARLVPELEFGSKR